MVLTSFSPRSPFLHFIRFHDDLTSDVEQRRSLLEYVLYYSRCFWWSRAFSFSLCKENVMFTDAKYGWTKINFSLSCSISLQSFPSLSHSLVVLCRLISPHEANITVCKGDSTGNVNHHANEFRWEWNDCGKLFFVALLLMLFRS